MRVESGADAAHQTVVARFAARLADAPDAIAVIEGDAAISMAGLDGRAWALAGQLMRLGLGADDVVAVMLPRSQAVIVALLGVLQSGAAYLPIDPATPAERIGFMLADSRARAIVTSVAGAEALRAVPGQSGLAPILCVDAPAAALPAVEMAPPARRVMPGDLAYVMYTSGSTGRPKAVATTHGNVCALACDPAYCEIDSTSVVLQLAPVSFDAATFEIWGALLNGARLAVHPDGAPELEAIAATICTQHVSVMWMTAGLFATAAAVLPQMFAGVRQLLVGGDVVSPQAVATVLRMHPGLSVINGYGPTETTTFAATWPISLADTEAACLPIGRPLRDTEIFLLDAALAPVAAGELGEICIAGPGVARGYLGRPELTAERFVPCPWRGGGARMYRTGDVGWRRPDGVIMFSGRGDGQVKIRGVRVETGEVEVALRQGWPQVLAQVVVLAHGERGAQSLVAYLVPKPGMVPPDGASFRAGLAAILPDQAIPGQFVVCGALPLTQNGKLDREGLQRLAALPSDGVADAPVSEAERILCRLFADITGAPFIGRDDSFFLVGGDSLRALSLLTRARAEGLALSVKMVLRHQTPLRLARSLERLHSETGPVRETKAATGQGAPVFVLPGAGGDVPGMALLRTLCERELHLIDLEICDWPDMIRPGYRLAETINDIAAQITQLAPQGPIRLMGYSLGGQMAWAIGMLLARQGREIEHVVLIDSQSITSERATIANEGMTARQLTWRDEWRQLRVQHALGLGTKEIARIISRRLLTRKGGVLLRVMAPFRRHLPIELDYHLSLSLRMELVKRHATRWYGECKPDAVLDAPVTLLRADATGDSQWDLGWQRFAPRLRVIDMPGDHRTILAAEFVGPIAEQVIQLFGGGPDCSAQSAELSRPVA